ncbi:MAG: FAD-dependent oxidoreductase, partial [Acidobacteriota bacterium]|nr:FAD-dependent oxidoreductase [Acidobacteriota bacterium]
MSARKTIAVLGGGSAGFTAARTAARLGARVILFMGDDADRASLCVNRGCMPSKAMFEPIDAAHHARRLGLLRVEPLRPDTYLADIVAWKEREIARFRAFRQRAIRQRESDDFVVVRRSARFVDPHTLASGDETHRADAVIIASGSVPSRPPIAGVSELGSAIWSNEDILSNEALPRSLVLIGAGAIGLEFALRYARLGCAVTVVARTRPLSRYPVRFGERLA